MTFDGYPLRGTVVSMSRDRPGNEPPITVLRRVLLIGAGGHARVCISALRDSGVEVVGSVSDRAAVAGLGIDVVGVDTEFARFADELGVNAGFVAIGDNRVRARFAAQISDSGRPLATAISRSAIIDADVTIGAGSLVMPGAVINAASTVGPGAIVNTSASVDHDCTIGAFVHVAPGATLGGGVTIEAYAMIGIGATV
ncbi:MAG TPA: hypothetical protein VMM60_14625, partial [Ilumatobacter sp.]|nr:hypothetical protein [Ilumatobacter sp.]